MIVFNENITISPIEPADNKALARIIRSTLEEFGANHPGTVYFDATTDDLYHLFSHTSGSAYFVARNEGIVVGGGGIFPTEGLPDNTCELVKMYLLPEVRKLGLGRFMLEQCMEQARSLGYTHMYLETMPELQKAVQVYEKAGFDRLKAPLGHSGHFGCAIQMMKAL